MNLNKRERKTVLLALLIAIDTEASIIDAHSKTRLRKGNLVRYYRREDRPDIRRAQSRVARFEKMFDKLRNVTSTKTTRP